MAALELRPPAVPSFHSSLSLYPTKLSFNLHSTRTSAVLAMSTSISRRSGDGILIVDHGSRRHESNKMLDEFVSMFKEKTGHTIVEAAHMELASPTIQDGFSKCVEQGADRIVITPYFLFPGRHWEKDIPALAAAAAQNHPGISYLVTAPIGLHELMVKVIEDRMERCLSRVEGKADECAMCAGTNRCIVTTVRNI